MLDDNGFEVYEEDPFPIAYLLTFRTFGTWLDGDARASYGRYKRGPHGTKHIPSNVPLNESMYSIMKQAPIALDEKLQRRLVAEAINDVCEFRQYSLNAVNVRSNHTHSVVSASVRPEKVVN